jgi:hypothetical protein
MRFHLYDSDIKTLRLKIKMLSPMCFSPSKGYHNRKTLTAYPTAVVAG